MTVCMVISLLTIPYIHRIYTYVCVVLANPKHVQCPASSTHSNDIKCSDALCAPGANTTVWQNLFALMNIKKELWDEDVFQAKVLGMKVRRFFHSLQLTYLISTSSMHQDPVLKYCTSSFHQPCLFRPKSSGTKKQCHMAKLTSWFGHTALSNAHQWLLCLVLCFCSCITFLFGNSCKLSCKKLTYSRPDRKSVV